MGELIQAIRGMNDILPDATYLWRYVEQNFTMLLERYGYEEIRFPLLENTRLFKRTLGEITDIVEKEMYSFNDLNGEMISLRPEGTASCVRACLEHSLFYNQQPKLWYIGPMFRHEKPQKGRYRQFHQLGVEAFGIEGIGIELELIALCNRFWKAFNISEEVQLEINTLGEISERQAYRDLLVNYLKPHFHDLDEDSQRRLDSNPLRILDSKHPHIQALINKAPKLFDTLSEESKQRFRHLCQGLDLLGIPYKVNHCLVRGLDYYCHTVFEWTTSKLGSQGTICAGGRYDKLVQQLGGQPTPAVGFAIGLERFLLLIETMKTFTLKKNPPQIYVITVGTGTIEQGLVLAEVLRSQDLKVILNTSNNGFKSQFKKADQSGADYALVLGVDEVRDSTISIKDLRRNLGQVTIPQHELLAFLKESFKA